MNSSNTKKSPAKNLMKIDDSLYGGGLKWFNKKVHGENDYGKKEEYFHDFEYGALYKQTDQGIQCELLNAAMEIDPALLPYDQRMALYLKEFGFTTSAHGIPMIVSAENKYTRTIWAILYMSSFIMFWVQISNVVEKYNRMEKIVDIKLVFEAAAFPAITLCNLNPYKKSKVGDVDLVKRTVD